MSSLIGSWDSNQVCQDNWNCGRSQAEKQVLGESTGDLHSYRYAVDSRKFHEMQQSIISMRTFSEHYMELDTMHCVKLDP